jgi:hypothetical protein
MYLEVQSPRMDGLIGSASGDGLTGRVLRCQVARDRGCMCLCLDFSLCL